MTYLCRLRSKMKSLIKPNADAFILFAALLIPCSANAQWIFVPFDLAVSPNSRVVLIDALGNKTVHRLNAYNQSGGFVVDALTYNAAPLNQVGLQLPPFTSSMVLSIDAYTNTTYTTNWSSVTSGVAMLLPNLIGAFFIGFVAAFVPSHFLGWFDRLVRRLT